VKMRKWEWKERENVESVFFSLFLWVSLSLETVITTSRKSRENPASFLNFAIQFCATTSFGSLSYFCTL
jgi:hypothetical protein